jgi:hypothetical protein
MLLKNKMKIIGLNILFIATSAMHAATVPSSMPKMTLSSPNYGDFCQNWIDAMDFKPAAMKPIMDVELALINDLYIPVFQAVNETTLITGQTFSDAFNKMKQNDIEASTIAREKKMSLEKQLQDYELSFTQNLKAETEKAKSQFFEDDGGAATQEYFKQMCTKSKIAEKIDGSKARYKESTMVAASTNKTVHAQANITSTTATFRKQQKERYEAFCSFDDQKDGLCEEVSQMQNGDLEATILINPVGYKSENASDFTTRYTYNPRELDAAKLYASNVIGILGVEPPTINEINDPKKQKFVAMYKHVSSSMNLARYTFNMGIEKRKPLNEEGTKMSNLDYRRFLLGNLNDENKVKSLEDAAGGHGQDIALYMALAMTNKLSLEIYAQKERMKNLEAALLVYEENKGYEIEYMESRK